MVIFCGIMGEWLGRAEGLFLYHIRIKLFAYENGLALGNVRNLTEVRKLERRCFKLVNVPSAESSAKTQSLAVILRKKSE